MGTTTSNPARAPRDLRPLKKKRLTLIPCAALGGGVATAVLAADDSEWRRHTDVVCTIALCTVRRRIFPSAHDYAAVHGEQAAAHAVQPLVRQLLVDGVASEDPPFGVTRALRSWRTRQTEICCPPSSPADDRVHFPGLSILVRGALAARGRTWCVFHGPAEALTGGRTRGRGAGFVGGEGTSLCGWAFCLRAAAAAVCQG